MKLAVRRTTTAVAAMATAGVSSLFLGAAPAYAATEACGETGTLVGPGICEQTFTAGTSAFTPTAQMTKLEVLLVGAGGSGADQPVPNTNGYAAAGGGGEVKVVDFTGTTDELEVTVATPGNPGTIGLVSDGLTTETVNNGSNAMDDNGSGASSGNGNAGAAGGTDGEFPYGSGGGAGASPTNNADGGAGVVVSSLAAVGSLFSDDDRCFGGGGAIGFSGTPGDPEDPEDLGFDPAQGIPGCGAGGPTDATATSLFAPAPNSGGGGGGLNISQSPEARAGATGFVAIRWNAADVTLTFDMNGHGTAPAAQVVPAGTAPAQPADPTATGYDFEGWFTDEALTVPADFSAPLNASATFYAKWSQILPATGGGGADPAQLSIGLGTLLAGTALAFAAYSRKRRES